MTLARDNHQIESDRLTLRMIGPEDLEFFAQVHADPEVARYLSHGKPRSAQESLAWLQSVLGTYDDFALGQLAVLRKSDGMLIGRCGLSELAVEARASATAVPRGWYQREDAPADAEIVSGEQPFLAGSRKISDTTRGRRRSTVTPLSSVCVADLTLEVLSMRPLRYSINVTLDGCCDHRTIVPDQELHRHAVENLNRADALLFGRVTYKMMEEAFRSPVPTAERPEWMDPFARTIDAAKKYVVSSTLDRVDWNAELVRGDLENAVQQLKQQPGKGLFVGGVKLPLALAELGLIDEYEFVVQPVLVGQGPTIFAGLSKRLELKLVNRLEFGSGAVAMRYEPRCQ